MEKLWEETIKEMGKISQGEILHWLQGVLVSTEGKKRHVMFSGRDGNLFVSIPCPDGDCLEYIKRRLESDQNLALDNLTESINYPETYLEDLKKDISGAYGTKNPFSKPRINKTNVRRNVPRVLESALMEPSSNLSDIVEKKVIGDTGYVTIGKGYPQK